MMIDGRTRQLWCRIWGCALVSQRIKRRYLAQRLAVGRRWLPGSDTDLRNALRRWRSLFAPLAALHFAMRHPGDISLAIQADALFSDRVHHASPASVVSTAPVSRKTLTCCPPESASLLSVAIPIASVDLRPFSDSRSRSRPTTITSRRTGTTRPHAGQTSGRLRLSDSSPTTDPSQVRQTAHPGSGRSTASACSIRHSSVFTGARRNEPEWR